mmetsp:Transcript_12146/g.21869  ORF Transcript_12146/g.21869 Transcript_12146/m.21869 type:complete len:216 (-) Transcript_12146:68-715(-)
MRTSMSWHAIATTNERVGSSTFFPPALEEIISFRPFTTVSDSALRAVSASAPSPPTCFSVSYALFATVRHSGSDTFSFTISSSGSSLGRKGATSSGFSTSLDMLSIMSAAFRLMGVERSRRPRMRMGHITDRVGASTVCTKVVEDREWTHSGTSDGLARAETSTGMKGSRSLLATTLQISVMVSLERFCTSRHVSHMTSQRGGIISGRARAISFL